MSQDTLNQVVHWLRRVARPLHGSDAELLQEYVSSRDDAAFTEILRRHGPLVWRVCRHLLRHEFDAEDAFQATFLVLARQAGSIRKRDALASWLFGVAQRSSRVVLRCRRRETAARTSPCLAMDPQLLAGSAELCDRILEAVRLLPEKYRLPLLLCGLQGLTKVQAAQQLGCPEGTLSGRLARARRLLEQRLLRQGITVPQAIMAGGMTALPTSLQASTLAVAHAFALGSTSAAAAFPVSVAREVVSMQAFSWKLSFSAALLGLATILGGVVYSRSGASPSNGSQSSLAASSATQVPRWQERLRLPDATDATFSPDGKLLACIGRDNVVRFLDTTRWQEVGSYDLNQKTTGRLFGSAFSPDSRCFSVGRLLPGKGPPGELRSERLLVSVSAKAETMTLPDGGAKFSPAGTIIASRQENVMELWDYTTGALLRKLPANGLIKSRGDWFSPDGRLLFAPTATGKGKLFEVANGNEIATLEGFNPVWAKDGLALATQIPGCIIKLWDTNNGRMKAALQGFNQPSVRGSFSPDGRLFLTCAGVDQWGLKPDGDFDLGQVSRATIRPARVPIDLRLWDVASGNELARLPGQVEYCHNSAGFTGDGRLVGYLRLTQGFPTREEAILWDVAANEVRHTIQHTDGIFNIFFTPDGKSLHGTIDNREGAAKLRFWDVATGRPLPVIPGADGYFKGFTPDGKTFLLQVGSSSVEPKSEYRIFRWSEQPLTLETRGVSRPLPVAPPKP